MMSETIIGPSKDLLQYLAAQVQKINATVVSQQQELAGLQDLQSKIERQSRKIGEIEKKLKVLEVYQSENFQNSQRLFNAHLGVELLEKKVDVLQQMSHGWKGHKIIEKQPDEGEEMKSIELRVSEIQEELKRYRHKSAVLAKFRRELSPAKCESTKDISMEGKGELRRLQKKLRDFILERLEEFQKRQEQLSLPPKFSDQRAKMDQNFADFTPKVRIRNSNPFINETSQPARENCFKKRIDDYYNEATEKKEGKKNKTERCQPKEEEQSKRKKEKKSKSKAKSHSKSSSYRKGKRRDAKSSEGMNLVSVNEYLRLRQYRKV